MGVVLAKIRLIGMCALPIVFRSVCRSLVSASGLGPEGRRFESLPPDHYSRDEC